MRYNQHAYANLCAAYAGPRSPSAPVKNPRIALIYAKHCRLFRVDQRNSRNELENLTDALAMMFPHLKREKPMQPQADAIVEIDESQVGYFGGLGKMLHPSPATVAALIQQVPAHKLLTTDLLRRQLAAQFNVQGTCPVTTKKALQTLANDAGGNLPYWRVIKQNGELNAIFPGGVAGQAALLQQEGFTIDTSGKAPKVKQFKASLVRFDREGQSI